MIEIEGWIQAFKTTGWEEKRNLEIEFNVIMLEWASKQPSSRLGFIDVAAGLGIEARTLAANGFPTISQDASEVMVRNSVCPTSRIGSAHKLEYPDNCFSGILIKDAWLFLSLEQRIAFLQESKRTLVSGGSILLLSEGSDIHRARYVPKQGQFPQTLPSSDFPSYQLWLSKIAEMQKEGDSFYSIEYSCLTKNVEELACLTDLQPTILVEYDDKHLLATQNRWLKRSGFVVVLKKS